MVESVPRVRLARRVSREGITLDPDQRHSRKEFDTLSITEVLDEDPRPTFAIDLDPDGSIIIGSKRVSPIFCNSALRLHERLLDAVVGSASDASQAAYEEFSTWATGTTQFDDSRDVFPNPFLFSDLLWTGSTVRKRWRLISGNLWSGGIPARDLSMVSGGAAPGEQSCEKKGQDPSQTLRRSISPTGISANTGGTTLVSSKPAQPPRLSGSSSNATSGSSESNKLTLATPEKAVADWTVPKPRGVLSPHIAFARTVRWENTPLGPMKSWSREFRQTVNLVMSNPHPAAIFWGSDLTMLYNEAYAIEVAGRKHPNLMGTGFSGPFSELWDSVKDIFAECARTGISIRKDDDYLPIERRGFLEETFYSWSWTPLYGGTNRILGFYNAPFETTQSVLRQRRMRTIHRIGENLSRAQTKKHFWKLLLEGLEHNHFDVPFALLYSVGDNEDADRSSTSSESTSTISARTCFLEGSIAVPDGHIAAPTRIDLRRSPEGFIPAFREAMRTREPTVLHTRNGLLPEELLEGIAFRGFGEPCREAIIFPVRPTNSESVLAFLLIGVNPRRPYDDGYKAFTAVLNRQLATSLASYMLYEDEVRRSHNVAETAALEQQQLSQQLALQTSRLKRMTELSPLGMFLLSPEGILREGNDRYFEVTGHPRGESFSAMSWMEQVEDSSKKTMEAAWHQLIVDNIPWTGEVQLKRLTVQPTGLDGEAIDYWVLISAQPEFAEDGSVRAIMGSITDISHLKWAQGLQNRRLQEAEETRRQQNEFIDITSHEMRNPLSAILQCADDILSTLKEHQSKDKAPPPEVVESCIEAARTISLCVQFQKSIVDDILTVSKLDSNLLALAPTIAQPTDVVSRVVRMFEPELQAKEIKMTCEVEPTFTRLAVDWMTLDPSRVLQVLINLVTNAIKFTASSAERKITLSMGVSRDPPLFLDTSGFRYIPRRTPNAGVLTGDGWGEGEPLYVRFQVEDTGCGLTSDEVKVLFKRFSQASPRTHAQYGGSGLGLFISRQLAELHGGQVGVSSVAGRGSTFGFFIQGRRSAPPDSATTGDAFAIEQDLVGAATLSQPIAPQRQDLASPGPASDLVATKAVARKEAPKFNPRALEVLVVEDNLVNQNVLVRQLKKIGIGVSVANDGVEALAFLEETAFCRGEGVGRPLSVVLMDLEMPNMDGLTCVREIRAMQQRGAIVGGAHVPVIAVTANVRDEQIATALKSGMDDVVSKPFRIPDLIAKIKSLLAALGLASSAET
ncbi:hypothetical protein DL771_007112 [Monosporascus sp. 5C6A]|nr:hypothetical protein DL771_007112 [Monosporascus sp. 5C6A]